MIRSLETFSTVAIVLLISALMSGAVLAWASNGAAIWLELRIAEIAGCFGF